MTLPWYRSWPSATDWAERKLDLVPHVVDDLPKLMLANYDYRFVSDYQPWPERSFCMLEWDIALDPWSRKAFAAEALLEPRRILVAPYRYHDTWCMFQGNDGAGPTETGRPVIPTDDTCDSFGLGCIYLPQVIVSEFLAQMDKFGFSDGTFGHWYRQKYGPARLTWRVHPQHLHSYDV